MGIAQIHGKCGGCSLGFEKLWEGDVHTAMADITGGTLNLDGYHMLLIHYSGTVTATDSESVYVGIGEAKKSGNSTRDVNVSGNSTKQVDITLPITRTAGGVYEWMAMRSKSGIGVAGFSNPLSFCSDGMFTADLHFEVYGIKL